MRSKKANEGLGTSLALVDFVVLRRKRVVYTLPRRAGVAVTNGMLELGIDCLDKYSMHRGNREGPTKVEFSR